MAGALDTGSQQYALPLRLGSHLLQFLYLRLAASQSSFLSGTVTVETKPINQGQPLTATPDHVVTTRVTATYRAG
jgi:hypothetical protein